MAELGGFHTFSVVGRCARTGDFGVAVATARPAVGSVVPWAGLAGAVATQARTNTAIGRSALALYHNLRVDDHAEPVAELRRLFELTAGFTATLLEQYGDDGLRRYRQVKR